MGADMYPSPNGRRSLPPQVLAVTVVLQALNGLSDFATVQALRCDLRWQAACGLGLVSAPSRVERLARSHGRARPSAAPAGGPQTGRASGAGARGVPGCRGEGAAL
jgi:hypothetical protein